MGDVKMLSKEDIYKIINNSIIEMKMSDVLGDINDINEHIDIYHLINNNENLDAAEKLALKLEFINVSNILKQYIIENNINFIDFFYSVYFKNTSGIKITSDGEYAMNRIHYILYVTHLMLIVKKME